jgi:hypothetical protein
MQAKKQTLRSEYELMLCHQVHTNSLNMYAIERAHVIVCGQRMFRDISDLAPCANFTHVVVRVSKPR